MPSASFTVTTTRSPDQVFAFVADLRNGPSWFPMIDEVELVSGHEPGTVGARFLVTAERRILDDIVLDYTTVAAEPGPRSRSRSSTRSSPRPTATASSRRPTAAPSSPTSPR